jgi:hypothetical protein
MVVIVSGLHVIGVMVTKVGNRDVTGCYVLALLYKTLCRGNILMKLLEVMNLA